MLNTHRVGNALDDPACLFQLTVPGGCWFASEVAEPNGFALVGCTVAPGFEFADFELGRADRLVEAYPQHESIIRRLCRR